MEEFRTSEQYGNVWVKDFIQVTAVHAVPKVPYITVILNFNY